MNEFILNAEFPKTHVAFVLMQAMLLAMGVSASRKELFGNLIVSYVNTTLKPCFANEVLLGSEGIQETELYTKLVQLLGDPLLND